MKFSEWEAEYERILRALNLSRLEDERSSGMLQALLEGRAFSPSKLRTLLRGKSVIVVGAGPGPLPRHRMEARDHVVIAADGATSRCLAAGTLPDLIVTDLDGDMPDEVTANQAGSWVVIHAHGDNAAALRHWVPRLRGKVCGSTPGRPRPGLLNVGGFTDGDRAVFLAEAYGARRVLLSGFDFHRLRKGEGEVKRRKLRVAQHLIDAVARRGKLEVYRFTSRGVQPWRIPRARTTRPAAAHSRTGA